MVHRQFVDHLSLVNLYTLAYEKRNIKIQRPIEGQAQKAKEKHLGVLLFCLLGFLLFFFKNDV